MTELIFLRHGETAGNRRKNYIGRTDEPLSEEGAADIERLAARGIYPDVERLLVSPLFRCKQTAALIYPKLSQVIIDDFAECDFGDFENKNYLDLAGNSAYQAWIDSGGKLAFPNGESREQFVSRVCRGFERAAELLLSEKIGRAAIVVHGGTIMSILSTYTAGGYYDFMTKNGGGWLVKLDGEMWKERKLQCLGQLPWD